ncbi:copper chaperone [Streptomyces sp. H27-D2]|uniref:copper chaperone n=1 Tax=Streptomyces sp. H27-D2 TaxID=3046304 RepID=UPI002DBBD1F6|nr:DUF2182 domain-containing protein [Streptomyces sp. H27-D2]MEC4018496.1 DUF2182 domain-containing protein [Streptomyces sp. H27-D2]
MPHFRSVPAAPKEPVVLLPRRDLAIAWILMVLLAALAWVLTIAQSRDMAMEPGTMGLALPVFLPLWVIMMVAMMFPSVVPVAITWARAIGRQSAGAVRVARTAQFAGGYLLAWTAFGLFAYGALSVTGQLVDGNLRAGRPAGPA